MTVNWWVSDSVCISHWGSASDSRSCLTDGAFNWLRRRGTNVGQSSEELMQNNRGLLFLTEGPPLDQIIGQAVDISLPSIVSTQVIDTLSLTQIQMIFIWLPYNSSWYVCCQSTSFKFVPFFSCISSHLSTKGQLYIQSHKTHCQTTLHWRTRQTCQSS